LEYKPSIIYKKKRKEEGKIMYLIVGLGNPEPEYSKTRHNMGFDVVNRVATSQDIAIAKHKFKGIYGEGRIGEEDIILLKPQTYMNLSGVCIKRYMDFFNIEPKNLIVVYDDMDTSKGTIRIRKKGTGGSHNGMKSIVEELGTTEFARIRVGIGRPIYKDDIINYVIRKIGQEEYTILETGIEKAKEAVLCMIENGYDKAMNIYNERGESSERNSNNEA